MNTLNLVGAELEEILFGDDYADRSVCAWWNDADTFTTNLLRYAVNNGGISLLNIDALSPAINNIDSALSILGMALDNELFVKDVDGWYIYPVLPDIRLMLEAHDLDRTYTMLQIKMGDKTAAIEIVGE